MFEKIIIYYFKKYEYAAQNMFLFESMKHFMKSIWAKEEKGFFHGAV